MGFMDDVREKRAAAQAKRQAKRAADLERWNSHPLWARVVTVLILALIVGLALKWCVYDPFSRPSTGTSPAPAGDQARSKPMNDIEALTECQYAIRAAMVDPEKTDVPYVSAVDRGTDWAFEWSGATKLVRTRNRIGNEVPARASCSVNKAFGRITSLVVDGQALR